MKNLGTFMAGMAVGAVGFVGLAVAAVIFEDEIDEFIEDIDNMSKDSKQKKVAVGDMIQWESDGKYMFPSPQEVTRVEPSIHGTYVFVEFTSTGIPIDEAIKVS